MTDDHERDYDPSRTRRRRPYAVPSEDAEQCPVRGLGAHEGVRYYIVPSGERQSLADARHSNRQAIAGLFRDRVEWLRDAFSADGTSRRPPSIS